MQVCSFALYIERARMLRLDVGGGEDKDERVHSLSNISLRWMIREIARSQCGILLYVVGTCV